MFDGEIESITINYHKQPTDLIDHPAYKKDHRSLIHDEWIWETAILRMLKSKRADLSSIKIAGKFDGDSEAWSKSTFPVKSIKELMQLTEEFEEENKGL